jgi:uncharacterized phage infection (PIP) family protein YhgE
MTTRSQRSERVQLGQALILALLGLGLVGCRSTGYEKSDAAARSLQSAAAEVQTQNRTLEMTLTALNELVNKPSGDLKPQFRSFSSSLDRLIDAADRTSATGKRIQGKTADYFEAWDKQLADMNYEYVRKSSESRRSEVSTRFEAINRRYQESEEVVRPLIAYLVDIRKALSADLTPGGLAAVKNIVSNAQENATKVQTVLTKLATDLADSGSQMSSVALQNTRVEASGAATIPPEGDTASRP